MKVVNLTTHDVSVKNKDGELVIYKQSGHVARAISKYKPFGVMDNIIIEEETTPSLDFGIDKIEPYTIYIVSYQFANKLKFVNHPNKHQFVYPCSCKAEREVGSGDILCVPSLITVK